MPTRRATTAALERLTPTLADRRAAIRRMTRIASGSPARIEAHERELAFADSLGLDPVAAEHLRGIFFAGQQLELQRDALNTARAVLWLRALQASGLSDDARVPFPFDDVLPWHEVGGSDAGVLEGPAYVPPSSESVAPVRVVADVEAPVASGSGSVPEGLEVGGLSLGGDEVI